MPIFESVIVKLAIALAIGLLIGAERGAPESKGPSRSPAGLRTFAVASLAGAVSFVVGGELLLAVTTMGAVILTAIAYFRSRGNDPGLTSEMAFVLTVLLGGLAMSQPVPCWRLPWPWHSPHFLPRERHCIISSAPC
jgi:hypothetical protein